MSQIRSAQSTLNALRDGQIMNELAAAFRDAALAVKHHNKSAKIILEIIVAPVKGMSGNLIDHPIVMLAEVTTKLPKDDPESSIFFVDEEGPSRHMTARQTSIPGIGIINPSTGEISNG